MSERAELAATILAGILARPNSSPRSAPAKYQKLAKTAVAMTLPAPGLGRPSDQELNLMANAMFAADLLLAMEIQL